MPSFSVEYERLWSRRAREVGRELTTEEARRLEGELFQAWIDAERFDELIRTIHANHGHSGGAEDIVVLGYHLRERQDEARIHELFGGLISRRVKAFYQWWPRAVEGHVGGMRDAARACAEAMDVYTEYFISLDSLGLHEEKERLREEMRQFQARLPVKTVLPLTRPRSEGST